MNPFAVFMDIYGHCTPALQQIRTLVDAVEWTKEELEEAKRSSKDDRIQLWYQVAIQYVMTRSGTLRKRCRAENNLRSAWSRFLSAHVRAIPEVPPLPT